MCYRQATDGKDNSLMVQGIENSQKQGDRKPIDTNSRKAFRKREVSRKKSTSRKRIREKGLKTRSKSRKPKTCIESESVPISLQPTQCSLPYAFAEHYSGWFANWRRGEIFRLSNTVSQGSQATTTMEHNETQTRSLSPLNEIQASQTQEEELLFSMPPMEDSPSAQFGYLNVHADSTDDIPCEDLFSVPLFSQHPTMHECEADRKNGFQCRQVHTRKRIGSQMRLSSDRKRGARSVCNFRRRNHEVASDSEKSQSPQQRRVKREKNDRKREENHRSKIRRVKKENLLPTENQRIQPVFTDRIRRVKQEDLCKIAQNATQMCNLKSNKEKEIVSDSESDIQKHFDRKRRVKWRSKKVAPQRCVERVQLEQTSPSKTPPKSASTDSGLGASTDCSRPMNKLQLQRTKMKQTPLVDAIKQSPLAKHVPKFARHSQRKTSCVRNWEPDKHKEDKPRVSAPEGHRVSERKSKAQCNQRHSEVSKRGAVSIASLAENRAKWTNSRVSGNGVQVTLVKEPRVWEHRATLERVKNSRVALDSREIRTKQEQRPPENPISQPKIRKLERVKNSNLVVKKSILKDDKAKTTKPHARDVKMKMIFDRIMRDAKNSYAAATSTRR